ncbi:MAG: preprotein translocase subunit SecE [Nitrospirae bacterium]|nr:preprotein translocase subunit SecE [Nitrospirota bacterium]MBI5194923.1 preprotein translocase subunit SecE [Nitrospirota bacterium]
MEKIKNFLKEAKLELKKVIYPTREEVIGSTRVVIIAVLAVVIFLGLVDLCLSKLVGLVIK